MKKRIVIFQRIIPHYRTGFFKKFYEKYKGTKILYGQPYPAESLQNAGELNENNFVKCKNYYLDVKGRIFFSGIWSKLKEIRPEIVISVFNVGNLNIYILFLLKRFFKWKVILWSFGYDPETGFHPDKRFTDRIRLYLSQKADAVIFYWEKGRQEVAEFSKKTDHYFIAPNTLDTEKQFNLKEAFDVTGKQNIKSVLNVSEQFHFVYVGRLLKDKQIEILLKAFSLVEKSFDGCRLTVIGDGPEKNNLLKISEDLKIRNIHFTGEILDEEQTGKWIYISDAFVMPGRLGLSVVHSFCFGTPVISQRKKGYFHGEGIGYIIDGENGFLSGDKNENDMASKMIEVISDANLSKRLRENAFATAKNVCSIENMLNGFELAIEFVSRKK